MALHMQWDMHSWTKKSITYALKDQHQTTFKTQSGRSLFVLGYSIRLLFIYFKLIIQKIVFQ